jgi:hypothetical protein
MAIAVFAVDEGVVLAEVLIVCVVGQVDVDHIHLPSVGVVEHSEGEQVIALDECVLERLLTPRQRE